MPDEKGKWGFFEVKAEFDKLNEADLKGSPGEAKFRYWLLRLMFEVYGNVDSISVSLRSLDKSYHDMAMIQRRKEETHKPSGVSLEHAEQKKF